MGLLTCQCVLGLQRGSAGLQTDTKQSRFVLTAGAAASAALTTACVSSRLHLVCVQELAGAGLLASPDNLHPPRFEWQTLGKLQYLQV